MTRFLALLALLPCVAVAQQPAPIGTPPPLVYPLATPGTASLTGTTSLTNIAVVPVTGPLGKNGGVLLSCLWTYTNSANNKTLAVIWSNTSGATAGFQLGTNIVATTSATLQTLHIGRNQGATNVQKVFPATPSTPFGTSATAPTAGAVDTTLPSFLNINGTLALGTETINVEGCQGVATYGP